MNNVLRIPPTVGILLGFIFYEIGDTFYYLIYPYFFPNFCRLIGFMIVVLSLSKSYRRGLSADISKTFSFFFVWTIFMILRGSLVGNVGVGSDPSIQGIIQRATLSRFGAFAYLIPFIALYEFPLNNFYYLKRVAILFGLIAIFMSIFYRENIIYGIISNGSTLMDGNDDSEMTVRNLITALFPGYGLILFFLFCFSYIKGYWSYLFPIAMIIFFISMAIGGSRGQSGFNLAYMLFFFFLIVKYPVQFNSGNHKKNSRVFWYIILTAAFIYLLYFLYTKTAAFDFVLERAFGEKTLRGEITDGSRDILRRDMIKDFNDSPLAWIFGRGVNGAYDTMHLSTGGRRMWMEWGYLYLILKGGVVYLFLYVYCMVHAAYKGFFKSNNSLSKGLAFMCVALLLNLLSVGSEPQFSSLFVMSWFSFGLLERENIRMMSDEVLYNYFNVKNFVE